jgi:hypothetical protein
VYVEVLGIGDVLACVVSAVAAGGGHALPPDEQEDAERDQEPCA